MRAIRWMAGTAMILAAATAGAAGPDGKALFEKHCTECHESGKALVAKKDREAWAATIERMRDKANAKGSKEAREEAAKQLAHWGGGEVTAKEAAAIADYLAEVAGK